MRAAQASGQDLYSAAKRGDTEEVRDILARGLDTTEHKDGVSNHECDVSECMSNHECG